MTSIPLLREMRLRFALSLFVLTACAGRPVVAPAPSPAVQRPPIAVSAAPDVVGKPDTARADWHRLDLDRDGVLGVGSERALDELLAKRSPARRVVVAVIDGGVDTAHALIARNLWHNPREIAGNGKDDDGNGFIDDVFGWNLVTDLGGSSVRYDTFELTRLYAACRGLKAGTGIEKPSPVRCASVDTAYWQKAKELTATRKQVNEISGMLDQITVILRGALGATPLTRPNVSAFTPLTPQQGQARQIWLQLDQQGITPAEITKAKTAYEGQFTYGLDTLYAPRTSGVEGGGRGNRDVTGPDASHGTHVAGIIGATRKAGQQVQGIAPSVSIMAVRAVPDGDERDPDIAAAIRYAVDNGAQIINMSFGKDFSPQKDSVDAAVAYAERKGVLLVHAAGNDGKNLETEPSFPSARMLSGSTAANWLEVGASSWKGMLSLAAGFSNYGNTRVDLFAPGVDILSTLPAGGIGRESGTSMAAPVASGVAALLMAYFPELSAVDVKRIIMESVRQLPDVEVELPGDKNKHVKFGTLSRAGGVIDAYAAVKRALERSGVRP